MESKELRELAGALTTARRAAAGPAGRVATEYTFMKQIGHIWEEWGVTYGQNGAGGRQKKSSPMARARGGGSGGAA